MEDHHREIHPGIAWPLSGADALREELLAAYDEPGRAYHDQQHLGEVLTRLDELAAHGVAFEPLPTRLAAWFHDAVYDGERDAEERSAAWAEVALPAYVDAATVAEVARLVRLTESHRPDPADTNGAALSDADLGVLALPAADYATYAAKVRREYAHLSDEVFAAGRADLLADLLERPALFRTEAAGRLWEEAARRNITAELAELDRLAGPGARPRTAAR
ncbi:MAG TPA: hypothetical protein VN088_04265 [Nocardioides sp.]|nr:hypothetical protein [Nocardioides sp.]